MNKACPEKSGKEGIEHLSVDTAEGVLLPQMEHFAPSLLSNSWNREQKEWEFIVAEVLLHSILA